MNPTEAKAERIATLTRGVLDRIESGERLSNVLAPARAVFHLVDDRASTHWLDCEMYGLPDVPLSRVPRQDPAERAGVLLFVEMRSVRDVSSIRVNEVIAQAHETDFRASRGQVLHFSVGQVEDQIEAQRSNPPDRWAQTADAFLQAQVLQSERERVLRRVRDYLHQVLSKVWLEQTEELEHLRLLGPDYRLVIDNLEALETGVGDELRSALRSLHDDNPASWSAAALTCRNVVLKLGRTLFTADDDAYQSIMLNKPLDLRGDKEKNRLSAYIDHHWQRSNDVDKESLGHCLELADRIHGKGSQGKRGVRHAEAQQLVVDTFELVAQLDTMTGLVPEPSAAS